MDLAPLVKLAFDTADVGNATEAIEQARKRFAETTKTGGFSYEVVAPPEPNEDWLREKLLRPLVYHCESRGAEVPACAGFFVSLFVGQRLYFIIAAEVIEWASDILHIGVGELAERFGTHERETVLR